MWAYEIHDKDTDEVLAFEMGFESEYDAELHAMFEASCRKDLKNFYVRTIQIF